MRAKVNSSNVVYFVLLVRGRQSEAKGLVPGLDVNPSLDKAVQLVLTGDLGVGRQSLAEWHIVQHDTLDGYFAREPQ